MTEATRPMIFSFFDEATFTVTHLVADPATKQAVVIDPVLDYDPQSGEVDTKSVEKVLAKGKQMGLSIIWSLETHAHADHLSGSPLIKARTGARIGIGEHIRDVQKIFRPVFNATDLKTDGSDFDHLFCDGETFELGSLKVSVLHLPGHTPADIAYLIEDAAFIGDTLFMPDSGTARADFPGGDARILFRSIRKLLNLPPETRLFMCHDYKAKGRDHFAWETTIGAQRQANLHVRDGIGEDEFVALRETRDSGLAVPRLLLPSIQANIRAGKFPEAQSNGIRYLLIPVKAKTEAARQALTL